MTTKVRNDQKRKIEVLRRVLLKTFEVITVIYYASKSNCSYTTRTS
jgi:hypothetical protein